MSTARRQLPAIRFEEVRQAVDDALPRLDVAAFVGLAAAGPVDVPVAVEDVGRFREIFGPDLTLVHVAGGPATISHLGPTVEAFFANGGRRCWVVRVGDPVAPSRFALRGVVVPAATGAGWRLAELAARSPGSFADGLAVQPVLEVTGVAAGALLGDPGDTQELEVHEAVATADLLRLGFGPDVWALAVVSEGADPGRLDATGRRPAGALRVALGPTWWFERALPAAAPVTAHLVGPSGAEAVDVVALDPASADVADGVILELPLTVTLDAGDVLIVDGGTERLLLTVEGEPRHAAGTGAGVTSDGEPTARWAIGSCWRLTDAPPTGSFPGSLLPTRAERLTLTVAAFAGEHALHRLGGLALAAPHPRFAGALPSDDDIFVPRANLPGPDGLGTGIVDTAPPSPAAWADAQTPRFPLAGTGDAGVWLPLATAPAPDARRSERAITDVHPATALQRNGAADFGPRLFVDDALMDESTATLLDAAHHIAHLSQPARALRGIHSLLTVEEATLVSVPDAVQPGWRLGTVPLDGPPGPPALFPPVDVGGADLATWTAVLGAAEYELQSAEDAGFAAGRLVYRGADNSTRLPDPSVCPTLVHLRVRAAAAGLVGPWSNTVSIRRPAADFGDCAAPDDPLVLEAVLPSPDEEHVDLTWDPAVAAVELQDSDEPDFAGAQSRLAHLPMAVVDRPRDAPRYVRVRELDEVTEVVGTWSNTVTLLPELRQAWIVEPEPLGPSPVLLAVHRALLRFCAARGDLFAVLSLSSDLREPGVANYLQALTAGTDAMGAAIPPLQPDEHPALTYGAVYHPWVLTRVAVSGELRSSPPDGWALGTIARRTVDRGAWIAPANMVLADVTGLRPAITREGRARLTERGVNVLWREAPGFLIASANTLSVEEALRPVSSRRLLILLRRLALRNGDTYVFAPHDARFRALVHSQWERILLGLFRRGAFAGTVPAQAFQLRTDDTVNPPRMVELGRFVVEVAVAPSRPLEFIRVRLVASGAERVTVEEVAA